MTWDIVQQNPDPTGSGADKPWKWWGLSENPNTPAKLAYKPATQANITWDIVRENPDKPWSRHNLSHNPNITWDILRQNPGPIGSRSVDPWEWCGLSLHENITWDIVRQNPAKPWDWRYLSSIGISPGISSNKIPIDHGIGGSYVVQNNPDKPWPWVAISENPNTPAKLAYKPATQANITWDIVQNNPDIPWRWDGLSWNPNTTWDVVQENLDKPWNENGLSQNPTVLCSDTDVSDRLHHDRMVAKIQQRYRHADAHPRHILCRRRLEKEFTEMA